MTNNSLRILDFDTELAGKFGDINREWITAMFSLEPKDERVLSFPEQEIIKTGGHILFVEDSELGVVGTCALLRTAKGEYELTKMGVLESARGRNAGGFLLSATIARAKAIGARKLYLLTNRKCESAIHLYKKHGFIHDPEIMNQYGREYARCDVAMRFSGLT